MGLFRCLYLEPALKSRQTVFVCSQTTHRPQPCGRMFRLCVRHRGWIRTGRSASVNRLIETATRRLIVGNSRQRRQTVMVASCGESTPMNYHRLHAWYVCLPHDQAVSRNIRHGRRTVGSDSTHPSRLTSTFLVTAYVATNLSVSLSTTCMCMCFMWCCLL